MSLVAVASTPTRKALSDMSKTTSEPPMLLASAETYAAHELFGGQWAPTIADSELEKKHNTLLDFYVKEVDQRHFYGFIDFGDVMHTYDSIRHNWRYDIGGYAWDNAELGTDLWLWLAAMRSGRSDIFWLAYHMTRHVSE
jgi:hypothetical protein